MFHHGGVAIHVLMAEQGRLIPLTSFDSLPEQNQHAENEQS